MTETSEGDEKRDIIMFLLALFLEDVPTPSDKTQYAF